MPKDGSCSGERQPRPGGGGGGEQEGRKEGVNEEGAGRGGIEKW